MLLFICFIIISVCFLICLQPFFVIYISVIYSPLLCLQHTFIIVVVEFVIQLFGTGVCNHRLCIIFGVIIYSALIKQREKAVACRAVVLIVIHSDVD